MKPQALFFLMITILLCSCKDLFFEKEPLNKPVENFESIWQTFNKKYAVFEARDVDWNSLYNIYRPRVSSKTSDDELFVIITEMLSHLDDGHVSLMAAERPFWNSHKEFREQTGNLLFNFDVVKNNYINGPLTEINNQFYYGKINENIGYLFINHLIGDQPEFMEDFIRDNENSKGVIIDLRHNSGGDFTNGEVIASRFAEQKYLAFSAKPKIGPGPEDFGNTFNYFIEPKGEKQFTKPIVVITNRYTISAGENLVLYFRALPQTIIMGENTTGAMGERIEKEMPNGWIYSISGQLITAADGMVYEGPGIPPHIYSLNTEAELEMGVDRMLEMAIDELQE